MAAASVTQRRSTMIPIELLGRPVGRSLPFLFFGGTFFSFFAFFLVSIESNLKFRAHSADAGGRVEWREGGQGRLDVNRRRSHRSANRRRLEISFDYATPPFASTNCKALRRVKKKKETLLSFFLSPSQFFGRWDFSRARQLCVWLRSPPHVDTAMPPQGP